MQQGLEVKDFVVYRDSPAWCSRRLEQLASVVGMAFNVFAEAPFLIPLCVRVYTRSPQVQTVKKPHQFEYHVLLVEYGLFHSSF